MLRPDQDWTKVYCDTQAQADRMAADPRFMAPLLIAAFGRLVHSRRGSCVIAEFVPSDALHPSYVTARWGEMEGWIDGILHRLEQLGDFEECAELMDVRRAIAEREPLAAAGVARA